MMLLPVLFGKVTCNLIFYSPHNLNLKFNLISNRGTTVSATPPGDFQVFFFMVLWIELRSETNSRGRLFSHVPGPWTCHLGSSSSSSTLVDCCRCQLIRDELNPHSREHKPFWERNEGNPMEKSKRVQTISILRNGRHSQGSFLPSPVVVCEMA